MSVDPKEAVRRVCGMYYVPDKSYPGDLPADLQPWYAYTSDGGHSIICCLEQNYQSGRDLTSYLLPVPVKSVSRA